MHNATIDVENSNLGIKFNRAGGVSDSALIVAIADIDAPASIVGVSGLRMEINRLGGVADGLIEARSEQGELFGFDRLETELKRLPPKISAQAAVDRLVEAVMVFTGQAELADDLTVLVVRATEP